jgi:hypothetical protein
MVSAWTFIVLSQARVSWSYGPVVTGCGWPRYSETNVVWLYALYYIYLPFPCPLLLPDSV